MSTCVLYVDESGDVRKHDIPLKNGQTPIFTLTGLAFALKDWRDIDRELLRIKKLFLKQNFQKHLNVQSNMR